MESLIRGDNTRNMSYIVLARKWRPQRFSELLGQDHIRQTLVNAITSGKIAHAYLLSGIRGSGKTTTARLIAKALNCIKGPTPEPCNACAICSAIGNSNCTDVLEIDAASNRGIDEIRAIKENVKYLPAGATYKIYIIDEVHMLTLEAFNALLKTLEEPPSHVIFILATTDPHKVPVTISSRCQLLDFRPVDTNVLKELIEKICREENVTIESEAMSLVIKHAGGSFRDAVSLLDQLIAYSEGKITEAAVISILGIFDKEQCGELLQSIVRKDSNEAIRITRELIKNGINSQDVIQNLIEIFRDVLIKRELKENKENLESSSLTYEELDQILLVLIDAYQKMIESDFGDIILELTVLRICKIRPIAELNNLIARLENTSVAAPLVKTEKQKETIQEPSEKKNNEFTIPSAQVASPSIARVTPPIVQREKNEVFDWNHFVKKFTEEKPNLGSCLIQSYFLEFDGKKLVIGFAKNSFSFDRVNNETTKKILKSSLQSFYGKELDIVFTIVEKQDNLVSHEENIKNEEQKRLKETAERLKNHPSVSEIIESFGGEIIAVEESE